MLGVRAVLRKEADRGRSHLKTAQNLFDVAGAAAWAQAVGVRLARLDAEFGKPEQVVDPFAASRHVWRPQLTARELDVAMLAVSGRSNREIGEELAISVRTVEVHLGRAYTKLAVKNRVELTRLAHRIGQHS